MSIFYDQELADGKFHLEKIFTEQNCCGNTASFPDRTLEAHNFYEFVFAVRGTVKYAFNGTMLTLEPGCGILIRPGISHQRYYPHDPEMNALHFWGNFSKHDLYCCCCRLEKGELSIFGHHAEKNSELLYFLQNREQSHHQQDTDLLQPFFDLLLTDYLENMKRQENQTSCKQMDTIVQMIQLHIASRNGSGCSYEELSRFFGYSKSHLNHSFRKHTGMSIGEYINFIRWQYLQEAEKKGLKQKEIALNLGFSGTASFWLWKQKRIQQK